MHVLHIAFGKTSLKCRQSHSGKIHSEWNLDKTKVRRGRGRGKERKKDFFSLPWPLFPSTAFTSLPVPPKRLLPNGNACSNITTIKDGTCPIPPCLYRQQLSVIPLAVASIGWPMTNHPVPKLPVVWRAPSWEGCLMWYCPVHGDHDVVYE